LKTLAIFLIISSAFASDVQTAMDQKFVTTFQNYACKSFRDKATVPTELTDLDMDFTFLGISDSTRNVTIDMKSSDDSCAYHAYFSRKKGEKFLNFESSITVGGESCALKKASLDAIMEGGFRYVIKFNAYISLLFMTKVDNECLESSGHNLVEFAWEI